MPAEAMTIYTIGHSTRNFEDFVAILRSFDIRAVADVRLIPRSRRYPRGDLHAPYPFRISRASNDRGGRMF